MGRPHMAEIPSRTTCAIAGGGPAGLMTGYLLARAGVDVVVLEKHGDFLRDFRGDTIHPSTMDVLAELGLLDAFLELPHQEVRHAELVIGDRRVRIADLSHLPTRCKFIAFIPQWDFLRFLSTRATAFRTFELRMGAEAVDLVREGNRVVGVKVRTGSETTELRADLVIAADGRHSTLRRAADLQVDDLGAPMDVLWFKLARRADDDHAVLGRIDAGQMLVMLDRGDYWQCALIIRKGSADAVKAAGLAAFRARIRGLTGVASADSIASLDDVKLLTVTVDRLRQWHKPGLLCIGDAAHAMSPVAGVGINLAIQDAIAAANVIAAPLRDGGLSDDHLQQVQRRRSFPTWATQRLQLAVQNRVVAPVLDSTDPPKVPWLVGLMQHLTILQRVPGRLIGIGVRPEHVDRNIIERPPPESPSPAP
jgi:2-polyprenyl-6-methoxyphenol hydroxylase-like FAD-dependent oxidoreductase